MPQRQLGTDLHEETAHMAKKIVRYEAATVEFCVGITVDGYKMPDGEFRVGLTGAAVALGYSESWARKLFSRGVTQHKALTGLGFSGNIHELVTKEHQSPKTISLEDFSYLTLFAATQGKAKAIAISKALIHMSYVDFFRDAFGDRPLSIEEKRALFYKTFAATINWLAEDREDARNLLTGNAAWALF
ncbi:MAG: hypothetical protein ACRC62_03870 [Microcoleus sp.]